MMKEILKAISVQQLALYQEQAAARDKFRNNTKALYERKAELENEIRDCLYNYKYTFIDFFPTHVELIFDETFAQPQILKLDYDTLQPI